MTQTSGGGGEEVVDWEAVFRTIDHQPVVVNGNVARQHQTSGTNDTTTTTTGLDGRLPPLNPGSVYPPIGEWGGEDTIHGQDGSGGDHDLYQSFATHLNRGTDNGLPRERHSHADSSTRGRRTREHAHASHAHASSSRSPYALPASLSAHQQAQVAAPYDGLPHDLPFRAMLHAMSNGHSVDPDGTTTSNHQSYGNVPPPVTARERGSLRGRRRSRSLIPKRSASDGFATPLFTPQLNISTGDSFPFPSPTYPVNPGHHHSQSQSASTLPSHSDFFSLLSQVPNPPPHPHSHVHSGTTTPAPTPAYTNPNNISNHGLYHQPRSTLATPLGSPRFGTARDDVDPTPPSTGHSGDQALGTPGAEADGEDKRVRNTLASARFRAKRKAHLAEVEQQINHLENRSTTLARQVDDLKKENIFLKEMVQLKYGLDVDKRI